MISAKFGEGLEGLALFFVELGWDFDFNLHMEITFGVALEARHAVSFDTEIAASLRPCGDFHFHRAGEGRDFDFAAV